MVACEEKVKKKTGFSLAGSKSVFLNKNKNANGIKSVMIVIHYF
jgi:hypothetical protein